VKVAAPTAGITTLRDHVINGVIEGHCDCMYMVNLYRWDFDKLAALAAPRPLLISNTDKDSIFPLGGVMRIHDSTRRIYKMLDAEKNLGLQISEGPHKDTQPLNSGAFHWFERFLKGADSMAVIKEPAVPMFEKEDLRVFAELPKDEINTKIDETFVPTASPPVPQTKEEWEKMRDGWLKVLREKVFKDIPAATAEIKYESGLARQKESARRHILAGKPYEVRVVESLANAASRELRGTPFYVRTAEGDGAVLTLFEFLLSKDNHIVRMELKTPPPSFRQGPVIPGILKYLDVPQLVALAAERREIQITGRREDWTWALETAEKMGFAANLKIVPAMEVLEVKKIWDTAPHNAFTSLTKFEDEWFLTFRESTSHVPGTDGAIRVLVSKDAGTWESAALITETGVDLRDPKFCSTPDGRLMLTIGGSIYDGVSAPGAKRKRTGARTRTSFSSDGRTWTAPLPACEEGQWLWRVTPRPAGGPPFDPPGLPFPLYGVAYSTESDHKFDLSLWSSSDGTAFSLITALNPGRDLVPNETTLRFSDDGRMMALVRCERRGSNSFFGVSSPPYKDWSWTDTGHIIHGPDFLRLKDGRMYYSGRDYVDGKPNTTVGILTATGQAMPMIVLRGGGDCSYPGLAEGPDGQLFVSYYSSHEGKTAIYFARIKVAH
jgi:hypothetical protein